MIKVSICILLLLLLPLCWGSTGQYLWHSGKKQNTQLGSWYLAGWISFLAGFEILAVIVGLYGMTLRELTILTVILAVVLSLPAPVAALVSGRYRDMIKEKLTAIKARENQLLIMAFVCCFALIAAVYMLQGFIPETYYTAPEEVTAILKSEHLHRMNPLTGQAYGEVAFADMLYNLPALYAVIAKLAGLETEIVLFCMMPYICLVGMLLALVDVATVFFEKKTYGAVMLFAFAAVVLCGGSAYMNVPYDILHAPYEGTALLGSMLMPYLLYIFAAAKKIWSGGRRIAALGRASMSVLFCLAAALCFAGVGRGLFPMFMEIVLLLVSGLLLHAVKWKKTVGCSNE